MNGIIDAYFPDWEAFRRDYRATLFGSEKAVSNQFLFRGQSNADWKLESSFDRWFTGTRRPAAERSRMAQDLVARFRHELMNSPEHQDGQKLSEQEIMALGQHYGLPTRLLDWSRSLYIAAYFAFSDALFHDKKSKHVAIWVLNAKSPIWTGNLGAEIVNLPAKSNARLRNQESCFTLLNSLSSSLEDFVVSATAGSNETLLWRLAIPTADAKDAIQDLEFIGFGARRLLPDFEGYARSAFATIAAQ